MYRPTDYSEHVRYKDGFKEKAIHGDIMLPMKIYKYRGERADTMPVHPHWHDEFEILYVISGTARFTVGNEHFTAEKEDILFIQPGSIHTAVKEKGRTFDFIAIVFSEAMIDSNLQDIIQQKYIKPVCDGEIYISSHIGKDAEIGKYVRQMYDVFCKMDTAYELQMKAALLRIWYLLIMEADRGNTERTTSDGSVQTMKDIMIFLQENISEKITLDMLTKRFGMSKEYMCRFFKLRSGMTITAYINSCRVAAAVEMLRDENNSIGLIAVSTGYDNISYFNRMFKRYMHITPGEYRKGLNENNNTCFKKNGGRG